MESRYVSTSGACSLVFNPLSVSEEQAIKYNLLGLQISLVSEMAILWAGKPAFFEMMYPIHSILEIVASQEYSSVLVENIRGRAKKAAGAILELLAAASQTRRPLRLHNHRPIAIKTSMPKFEESYNPEQRYDPNSDRVAVSKLKAEHKRERKGALRELRKDANFLARENLRERKEKDRAYEKKFKRLVAEIQGEEGQGSQTLRQREEDEEGKEIVEHLENQHHYFTSRSSIPLTPHVVDAGCPNP